MLQGVLLPRDHRMGRGFKGHLIPTPTMGRDTFHQMLRGAPNHPYPIIPVRSLIPGWWMLLLGVPEPPVSISTPSPSPCRAIFPL